MYFEQDGPRSSCSGKKRRLQPTLWYLGHGHYRDRICGATTSNVWPSPHEGAVYHVKERVQATTVKRQREMVSVHDFPGMVICQPSNSFPFLAIDYYHFSWLIWILYNFGKACEILFHIKNIKNAVSIYNSKGDFLICKTLLFV